MGAEPMSAHHSRPRVLVLMATYNGGQWIAEQIDSILSQSGVEVRILASDDGSTDDTLTILEDRGVSVLEARTGKRGSAQNFCHIIAAASAQEDEYVALADQDDIWYPGRLARQVKILREGPFDAVSSSIDALYPDGTKKILRKDFPERRLDFICQSPGPGSTYVFTPQAFAQLQNDLRSGAVDTDAVGFHDWLLYTLARAHQMRWHIDSTPTLAYRQHEANDMGANSGLEAARTRAAMLETGWYREQFALMARTARAVTTEPGLSAEMDQTLSLLQGKGIVNRVRLAWHCRHLRRRRRDRIVLALMELLGLW